MVMILKDEEDNKFEKSFTCECGAEFVMSNRSIAESPDQFDVNGHLADFRVSGNFTLTKSSYVDSDVLWVGWFYNKPQYFKTKLGFWRMGRKNVKAIWKAMSGLPKEHAGDGVENVEAGQNAVENVEAVQDGVENVEAGQNAVENVEAVQDGVENVEAGQNAVENVGAVQDGVENVEAGQNAVENVEAVQDAADQGGAQFVMLGEGVSQFARVVREDPERVAIGHAHAIIDSKCPYVEGLALEIDLVKREVYTSGSSDESEEGWLMTVK